MSEITRITDIEELALGITRHYQPEQTLEQSRDILINQFELGLRCVDGDAIGCCYILNANGVYLIDAFNEGLGMFLALSIVKSVIREAFETLTDCIIAVYPTNDTESLGIRKRLGFKRLLTLGDNTMYFIQKG